MEWSEASRCALLGAVLGACSPSIVPDPAAAPVVAAAAGEACRVPRQTELRVEPPSIAPDERVPDFLISSDACTTFDSHELVGKEPFVVVFFASWCSVCEHRVPLLRDALRERAGQVTPLWISLDEASLGGETDAFLERHQLGRGTAVTGRDFLEFSLGYNPFRSVPVVVVVGRSGRIVAVQIGVRDGDDALFEQALDDAIDQAPERSLFTSFPRP